MARPLSDWADRIFSGDAPSEIFSVTSNRVSGFQGINPLSLMKALPALAFVAAFSAFVLFPFRFEIAGSMLFAAGFMAIALHDYTRGSRLLCVPAHGAPSVLASARAERFGLAA